MLQVVFSNNRHNHPESADRVPAHDLFRVAETGKKGIEHTRFRQRLKLTFEVNEAATTQ